MTLKGSLGKQGEDGEVIRKAHPEMPAFAIARPLPLEDCVSSEKIPARKPVKRIIHVRNAFIIVKTVWDKDIVRAAFQAEEII